jgi:hypothetical protein
MRLGLKAFNMNASGSYDAVLVIAAPLSGRAVWTERIFARL